MAIDAAGDIYVGGEGKYNSTNDHWFVGERLANGTFSVVDSQTSGFAAGVAIDASGNVFAVGVTSVTTTGKGNNKTTTSTWLVQADKWTRGFFHR